jgi:hypothetical protein
MDGALGRDSRCVSELNSLVVVTFASFFLFQLILAVVALRFPSLVTTTTVACATVPGLTGSLVDIKIRLQPVHRIVAFGAFLVRDRAAVPLTYKVTLNGTIAYLRNSTVIRSEAAFRTGTLAFTAGAVLSNELNVLGSGIETFDAIDLSLHLGVNFNDYNGFEFRHAFIDSDTQKLMVCVRVILAGCAFYAVTGFVIALKIGVYRSVQYHCIVLGVTACFATNPLGLWFEKVQWLAPVTMALFMSVFRLCSQFLIHNRAVIFAMPVVVAYGILEGWTTEHPMRGKFLIAFHILYSIGTAGNLASSFWESPGKAAGIGGPIILTIITTLLSEVALKAEQSSLPLLLYQASHILSAAAFLFLQSSARAGYEAIVSEDGEPVDLAVDLDTPVDGDDNV